MADKNVVNETEEKILNILDVDFGDFKRKAGLYLNELEAALVKSPPELRKSVFQLKQDVVYSPVRDIDFNIEKIRKTLKEIKAQL